MKKENFDFYKSQLEFDKSQLEHSLKNVYYWFASATECARDGSFSLALKDITRALSYMADCQHIKDTYLKDADVDYVAISDLAMSNAKEEKEEELKNK